MSSSASVLPLHLLFSYSQRHFHLLPAPCTHGATKNNNNNNTRNSLATATILFMFSASVVVVTVGIFQVKTSWLRLLNGFSSGCRALHSQWLLATT